MKNKRILICLIVFITSIVISCSWQIPENVSVKTKADYEFGVGRVEKSLDEYLDIPKLLEKQGTILPNGMKIYDYWPDKKDANVQRYLVKIPMAEIPIDLDSFMEQIDLTSGLKAMEFNKEIKVPEIKLDSVAGITLKLGELETTLNTLLKGGNKTSNTTGPLYLPEMSSQLTSITYVKGSLKLTGVPETVIKIDLGSGVEETVTLKAASSGQGEAIISLDGKTINLAKAKFTTIPPSYLPESEKANANIFLAEVVSGAKIKNITGLKAFDGLPPIEIPSTTREIPSLFKTADTGIVNCTIEEGQIAFELAGIKNATYEVSLKSEGGLVVQNQTADASNKHIIKLADASISEAPSKLTMSGSVNFAGADIDFTKDPQLLINPSLSKIKEVTADIGANASFNETFPLPKEVTDMVTNIKLNQSGFTIKYINGLPTGNDITISAKSTFLGLDSSAKLVSNGGVAEKTASIMSDPNGTNVNIAEGSKVDFDVSVKLPGATKDHPTYVTLSNFEFGKPYKIGLILEPKLDWESISVDFDAITQSAGGKLKFEDTSDLGIDLNKMLTDLGRELGDESYFTSIKIKEMPIYMFFTKPATKDPKNNPFEKLKFEGSAEVMVGTTPLGYILGGKDNKGMLTPVDKIPDLKFESNTVVNNFESLKPGEYSLKPDGLSDTINKIITTSGNLKVKYSLGLSGASGSVELKKEDLSGTAKIAVEAYIDLGFDMQLDKQIDLDLMKLDGLKDMKDKDVLQGQLPELKKQGLDKVFAAIKRVGIDYTLNALPVKIPEGDIQLKVKFNSIDEKVIGLTKGSISITDKEVENMFKADKLTIEKMNIVIPAGTFSIPRSKLADVNLRVGISTDGTIPIYENGSFAFGGGAK